MACEEGTRLNAASRYTRYTEWIVNGQLTEFIPLDTGEAIFCLISYFLLCGAMQDKRACV